MGAKVLFSEIALLSNKEGYCWSTNQFFADLFCVDSRTIRRWLKELIESKLVSEELIYEEDSFTVQKRKLIPSRIPSMDKIVQGGGQICQGAMDKNVQGAMDKNVQYNNINNNNININRGLDAYDSLINYINTLPIGAPVRDALTQWAGTVDPGSVSVRSLKNKYENIYKETGGDEALIKQSIDTAIRNHWYAFYVPKSKPNTDLHPSQQWTPEPERKPVMLDPDLIF